MEPFTAVFALAGLLTCFILVNANRLQRERANHWQAVARRHIAELLRREQEATAAALLLEKQQAPQYDKI